MKIDLQITIVILILLPNYNKSFLKSSYNKMLSTAKDYYKSKYGKDKSWHFLGNDPSEYPGTNKKYHDMNRDKWEEYYACLQAQNENLGPQRSIIPEAVVAFEGNFISFDCKICLSPEERSKIDMVEWQWAPLNSKHLTTIEYTEHILLSPEDKTLSIYNLREDQTGQYICKLGESLTAPYFLTVMNGTFNATEVHTKYAKRGPFPKQPEHLGRYKLSVDTEWGPWSSCSKCGEVGRRHKFGYCVIHPTSEKSHIKRDNATQTTTSRNSEHTTDTTVPFADLELFDIFQGGIPCLSHILPDSIKHLPQIKNRNSEIMTGFCKMPCKEETVFEVKDKNGNVIEKANNSAGIYSMLQGMPPVEPSVERMVQYERRGEHIIISCPGNLNSDAPIQWQIGSKKLIPELIRQQSMGRIHISVMDKINIKKAKQTDSNTYSCWQNNELAGTVRVVVENKIKLHFNHHIMLLGIVIILSVFLYVFTKAFLGRRYAHITK